MPLAASNIILMPTAGTCPPPWEKGRAWPLWIEKQTQKSPKLIRYVWCVATGQLWSGVVCDHRLLLSKTETLQVGRPLLVGYSIPLTNTVVVKTVVESMATLKEVDLQDADHVIDLFIGFLKPTLPKTAAIYRDANNAFLLARLAGVTC